MQNSFIFIDIKVCKVFFLDCNFLKKIANINIEKYMNLIIK